MTTGCRTLVKKCLGTYPPIVTPALNFDRVIMYFMVGGDACFGTPAKRAWLVPPENDGDIATIQLETYEMTKGCSACPQRGTIETSEVGIGNPMLVGTPVIFNVQKPGYSALNLGCEVDGDGNLLFTTPGTCLGDGPTDNWFVIRPLTTRGTYGRYIMLGTRQRCSTTDDRVLRAVPVGVSPGRFYLSWQAPTSAVGLDVDIQMLYDGSCLAAGRESCPLPYNTVVSGRRWCCDS